MNKEDQGFSAHLCKGRTWRPYGTLLCSCCRGEEEGSINFSFPDKSSYEAAAEKLKNLQEDSPHTIVKRNDGGIDVVMGVTDAGTARMLSDCN